MSVAFGIVVKVCAKCRAIDNAAKLPETIFQHPVDAGCERYSACDIHQAQMRTIESGKEGVKEGSRHCLRWRGI